MKTWRSWIETAIESDRTLCQRFGQFRGVLEDEVSPLQLGKDVTHPSILAETLEIARIWYLESVYIFELFLYNLFMSTMSVSEARENFSEAIANSAVEAVFIEKHGQAAAVLISPERYEQLMSALEEIEDTTAYDEALADTSPRIPWDEVKVILGL